MYKMNRIRGHRFTQIDTDKVPSRNKLYEMTPGFWRLARRDEGEYPSWIFD